LKGDPVFHTLVFIAQANTGKTIGDNILDFAKSFAFPVYLAVVIVFALKFLPGRRFAELAVFFVGAILIGAVIADPEAWGRLVKSIGEQLSSGV
jgi:hypothetical protein